MATAKLEKCTSPGSIQMLIERIKARGKILPSAIHKHFNSIWNEEEWPDKWNKSIVVPVHKKGDRTGCNNHGGLFLLTP
jgi:hypothetical protein